MYKREGAIIKCEGEFNERYEVKNKHVNDKKRRKWRKL